MKRHALIIGLLLGLARPAGADPLDHLRCHKVSGGDAVRYGVDLDVGDPSFADAGCQVVGRMRLACVPATKLAAHTLTTPPEPPPHPERVGPTLEVAYACYKLRCPHTPPSRLVSDQFQSDVPARFRTDLLCLPAELGPTTTTTTTLPPTCGDLPAPACSDGECPSGFRCANLGGQCGCITAPAPPCGDAATPACNGVCPPTEECTYPGAATGCTCLPPGTTLCDAANGPACDGACPPNAFCLGGASGPCICYPVSSPCGSVSGAPACLGSCPADAPICADEGGSCVCRPG
jgi:hypothetical protein